MDNYKNQEKIQKKENIDKLFFTNVPSHMKTFNNNKNHNKWGIPDITGFSIKIWRLNKFSNFPIIGLHFSNIPLQVNKCIFYCTLFHPRGLT